MFDLFFKDKMGAIHYEKITKAQKSKREFITVLVIEPGNLFYNQYIKTSDCQGKNRNKLNLLSEIKIYFNIFFFVLC
jgi:hypothetical protein